MVVASYNKIHPQQQHSQEKISTNYFGLKPPTDDSPFYFAKEQIPKQLILLIEMVLGVSAVLALLLVYYSKANKIRLTASSEVPSLLCRIDRVWLYIFGNNLYSKIPITAWNPYNGIDGHTIFHITEQWNRRLPERKTVQ